MRVYTSNAEISAFIATEKHASFSLGFVPTMGALHAGHLSLVKAALAENTLVVVSVFVNPTQFDNPSDLTNYPRTLTKDIQLLETLSKTRVIVYAPTVSDVYGAETIATHFDFGGLESQMEGKFRMGHFDGVGTIVKRLFEIVKPDTAYFGEKDFQQLQIIRKLIVKHKIPVNVIPCEIYRETSGLAMSSRNERLSESARKEAKLIYEILLQAKEKFMRKSAKEVTQFVNREFKKHCHFFSVIGIFNFRFKNYSYFVTFIVKNAET